MRVLVACIVTLALGAPAQAQQQPPPPQPPPQPQPQPQPHPQPQPPPPPQPQPSPSPPPLPAGQGQASAWYRFTLNDGRVIDVQIVGGDAANYHVNVGGAVYSVPRASVVSSMPLAQPTTQPGTYAPQPSAQQPGAYGPPPVPPVAQPINEDRGNFLDRNRRAAGWVYLGLGYFIVAPIALARRDNDSSASAGLIPVVGPLIWTLSNDDDDAFEDGWDWLAGTDCLIQTFGIYLVLTGGQQKKNAVTLSPMRGRGTHGLAVSGSF